MIADPAADLAPDVTVVIAAWGVHATRFLDRSVASVLAQEPRPTVLLLDNCSDPPLAVAGTEVHRLDRQVSIGAARHRGLELTRTEYVLFWDADDLMLPGTIPALRDALRAEPSAVAAVTRILDHDGSPFGWPRRTPHVLSRRPAPYAMLHAATSLFPTTGGVLVRTEALRAAGGFPDRDGAEDWLAGYSLALRGRILMVPHDGRLYRLHPASVSRTWDRRNHLASARAMREQVRGDEATPTWVRRSLPAIWLGQWAMRSVLGPIRRTVRGRPRESPRPR